MRPPVTVTEVLMLARAGAVEQLEDRREREPAQTEEDGYEAGGAKAAAGTARRRCRREQPWLGSPQGDWESLEQGPGS